MVCAKATPQPESFENAYTDETRVYADETRMHAD